MRHHLLAAVLGFAIGTATAASPLTGSDLHANPFYQDSTLSFHYPAFDKIKSEHFKPALAEGMRLQLKEVAAIAENPAPPTFRNTIVALEKSGQMLARVQTVFENMVQMNSNEVIDATEREMLPLLAGKTDAMYMNARLFGRVRNLYRRRQTLKLDPESLRLLETYYVDFVRAGAELSDPSKDRLRAINARLASLQASFTQNLIAENGVSSVLVETREELDGMAPAHIDAAGAAAKAAGHEGKFLVSLFSTGARPLTVLSNRALRERLMTMLLSRGSHGGTYDSRQLVLDIAAARAEKAALLGYPDFASYALEAQTANNPAAVAQLLGAMAKPAVDNARREAAALQVLADREQAGVQIGAADWSYYAEKLRAQNFNLDENQLKPYFELNNVLQRGVFYAASKLYGLTFRERPDLPVFDPEVRVWEVIDADRKVLGLFVADYYARKNKTIGGSATEYVSQSRLLGTHAVVVNHLSLVKPAAGQPTLMSYQEAKTMFHEFGHALHALFSDVKYPRFAGTRVPNDFVEYPSQANEMWALWPEVVANYARHYETGAPIPPGLLASLVASGKFDQGRRTTETVAASLLDLRWHQLSPAKVPNDVAAFEAAALRELKVDFAPVPPRFLSTYFMHTFGGMYATVYYSYLWSGRLQADTVRWFKDNGGLKRDNGDWYRKTVLSRGGAEDPQQLYRHFRGRDAALEPILEELGLCEPQCAANDSGAK